MVQKKQEIKMSGKKEAVAIGAVALAALASVYFLYGSKQAPKNRRKVKGWMLKAKGEVLEKIENVKDVSEEGYSSIVDKVMKKYAQIKSIDTTEVEALGKDLKKHWKNFQADLRKGTGKSKSGVSKAVK